MLKNLKLVKNDDNLYDIILEYDNNDSEFSLEFDNIKKTIKNNSQRIFDFIRTKAKNLKISNIKIALSGIIISTIAFSSFMTAFASNNKYSMAYLYNGTDQQQIVYVNRTNNSLNTVSPSYFDIDENGNLQLNYLSQYLIDNMHSQNIRVVPFLSNHWNRSAGINALQNVETLSSKLAEYIEEYNLDGINVDIENVTQEQKSQYTELVRLLRNKISQDKEVSVAVAANPNNWQTGWHGSYDYEQLSKYADYLFIMAYDEHFEGDLAGPIASIQFVENSIKYALTKTSADKLVIGIPLYGRVWSIDSNKIVGKGISTETINKILNDCDANVAFDEEHKSIKAEFEIKEINSEYIAGGDFVLPPGKYVAWYENDASYLAKFELVKKYNLKGVGMWSLGQEDVSIWNNFNSWINTAQSSNIIDNNAQLNNQNLNNISTNKEKNNISNTTPNINSNTTLGSTLTQDNINQSKIKSNGQIKSSIKSLSNESQKSAKIEDSYEQQHKSDINSIANKKDINNEPIGNTLETFDCPVPEKISSHEVTIIQDDTKLYATSSLDDNKTIDTISNGEIVNILNKINNKIYKIRLTNGNIGYVKSDSLNIKLNKFNKLYNNHMPEK